MGQAKLRPNKLSTFKIISLFALLLGIGAFFVEKEDLNKLYKTHLNGKYFTSNGQTYETGNGFYILNFKENGDVILRSDKEGFKYFYVIVPPQKAKEIVSALKPPFFFYQKENCQISIYEVNSEKFTLLIDLSAELTAMIAQEPKNPADILHYFCNSIKKVDGA